MFKLAFVALLVFSCQSLIAKLRSHLRSEEHVEFDSHNLSVGVYALPRRLFYFTDGSEEVTHVVAANPAWEVRAYNEVSAKAYVEANCSKAASAYDKIIPIAGKADIFRVCALLVEGGLYLDDDLLPFHPLDEITAADAHGLMLVEDRSPKTWWGNREPGDLPIWQAFIGVTRPLHPLFVCALDTIIENVKEMTPTVNLIYMTGPWALRKCSPGYTFRYRLNYDFPINIAGNDTHLVLIHKSLPPPPREKHYSMIDVIVKED